MFTLQFKFKIIQITEAKWAVQTVKDIFTLYITQVIWELQET